VTTETTGRVLVVTNDYPPRAGGIESFVSSLCARLGEDVVVYTARMAGSEQVDRRVGYRVVRDSRRTLLPTRRVARQVTAVAREHGCDQVIFGAAMPLGLLAGRLRTSGVRRMVALTHGHEVWWARLPVTRRLLRRVARQVDIVTYVSDYCRDHIGRALPPSAVRRLVRLSPGVDPAVFSPTVDGRQVRRTLGVDPDQPVVLALSRLVSRKGHDVLLQAWPRVLEQHPRAVLVIAGDGPARRSLARAAARPEVEGSVRMLPAMAWPEVPALYAAADVFALPCRTRRLGLEPEALGIVFLEAAATGLPVVVGRSGGAPETVVDGTTGYVVDPRSPAEVADRLCALLADPEGAAAMGRRGRERVIRDHSWNAAVETLRAALQG
jgi:phosphatidyl-myo-inositol dimannoside synthase